jgi:hypothetical protein|tara:strand:+ start:478 stop:696 length:219 start_codon:yes stop_codon:yes gene_type:complete
MTDLYDSDEEIKKILNKEDDISSTEMINKITENLYELETILQEKENEDLLKDLYNMLKKRSIVSKDEQCSIQ